MMAGRIIPKQSCLGYVLSQVRDFFPSIGSMYEVSARPITYMELRFGDTWSIWRRDARH